MKRTAPVSRAVVEAFAQTLAPRNRPGAARLLALCLQQSAHNAWAYHATFRFVTQPWALERVN